MFEKKLSNKALVTAACDTCSDYLERVISACPPEEDLEDRALYLTNALNQARGINFFANKLTNYLEGTEVALPTVALIKKIEAMLLYNLSKQEALETK